MTSCLFNIISIKEPNTLHHQNSNDSQILILGGFLKSGEFLYTQDIIWVITILNHIDTRANLPGGNLSDYYPCGVLVWLWIVVLKYYIDYPN